MADFELLAPGGHQELVDEVLDRLDTKADYDGYYAQLTAGAADNLTARGDAVDAEFMRRTSGGNADIESGHATIESIKGNAVVWNQLCKLVARTATSKGITYTADASGKVTISAPSGATGSESFYTDTNNLYAPIVGHKYIAYGTNADGTVTLYHTTMGALRNTVITVTSTATAGTFNINVDATFTGTYEFYPQLFDLTLMFGAGNEPETVAEFEAMYPESYYAYDDGSLKPVKLNGIETTGFNQWDEEWEVGAIAVATGQNVTDSNAIRSKNYNSCFPNTDYYIKGTNPVYVFWYDARKNYISNTYTVNNVRQSPANAAYFRVRVDGTKTYNNDICINLSWSGRRNGEYEAYWKAERLIALGTHFPTGLKRAGSVYDELTADEAIQRVGEVDLGTLTWTASATGTEGAYRMAASDLASAIGKPASTTTPADVTVVGYSTAGGNASTYTCVDKSIGVLSNGALVIYDAQHNQQSSVAAFKAAMSGVTLYYALATPTTTAIDPALNLTYKVDDWGTEQVIVPSATVSAEPKFAIVYGMNAVDTIRRLPTLYAGKDATEQALDHKADIDGYYAQMTVGAADSLTGRGDGVSASYLYRTTGGDADVADGTATVKSIHGRTVVWNQLAGDFSAYVPLNSNASSSVTDNVITVEKNSASSAWANVTYTLPDVTSGHVFLMKASFSGNTNGERVVAFLVDGSTAGTYTTESSGIIKLITTASTNVCKLRFYACYSGATSYEPTPITYSNVQLIDLTAMFGAGNEPSTVAEFEALYPEPYYPYDAGSLLSVQMEGIETVGFNQWDEEWEVGGINTSTGENNTYTDRIRAKNYIPVIPGTQLYIRMASTSSGTPWLAFYDDVKAIIPTPDVDASVSVSNNMVSLQSVSGAFTVPAGARYMRFYVTAAYGTTYHNDICINLSWSGYRNGEYEPYRHSERTIPAATYFPNGMRSAGSVYDELTSDAAVTRVGAVDLGTLTWSKASTTDPHWRFYATLNSMVAGTDMTCQKYETITTSQSWQGVQGITSQVSGSNVLVMVSDETYSDAAAFKAAMDGVILYYALATPTTQAIDPPLNLTYRVSDFGTERIMHTDPTAAPTQQVVYGLNVVDTVRRLPTEYISHDSFTQFTNALATFLDATITESWDATDGRYEYTITQNGE